MGTRVPAPNVPPPGGSDVRAVIDWIRGAYSFLQWLRSHPLLDGQVVTGTTDGTGSAQLVPHSLGRAFQGVIVTGVRNTSVTIVAATPANIVSAGDDPAKHVRINPSSATVTAFRLWVF